MGNTDTLFDDLARHGWTRVLESGGEIPARRGDLFIWGVQGSSLGAAGHCGVFYGDNDEIIHCNYGRNGITRDDHDAVWAANQYPPVAIFRYTASGTPFEPPVDNGEQVPPPSNPGTPTGPRLTPYSGVFYPNIELPVSADTDPNSPALANYPVGSAIFYDGYVFENGFAWISHLDRAGTRRFVAVGPDDGRTDTVFGTGFLNNEPRGQDSSLGLVPYNGVFTPAIQLPVSADTDPDSPALAYYNPGMAITYDSYVFANGYAWISYLDGAGTRRYIAVGPDDGRTDTVFGSGFLSNTNHPETQLDPGPAQLIAKRGQFVPDRRLPVSSDTTVESPEVAAYAAGSVIYYDSYIFASGLAWISYRDGAGTRRYVAVGPDDGRFDTVWGRGFFN